MAIQYLDYGISSIPILDGSVNSMPVHGQLLARKKTWRPHEREFWAADLYRGGKHLVEPTLAHCTFLTGAGSITGVWWALRREEYRDEVMDGHLPLVPPRAETSRVSASNGRALVVQQSTTIADSDLFDLVRSIGVNRVLDVAAAVEAAE